MALRRALLALAALAVGGCAASSSPTAAASCDDLAAHAIALRLESRLDRAPEADRDAHRDALSDALTPAYLATCERMTVAERDCWRDATSGAALADCVLPDAADALAGRN